ncbi:MAG: amino acid ABC transporter permease [Clostridia bacterium]|nr:amino acid ABC transporter permease [Clostridia bacterium]
MDWANKINKFLDTMSSEHYQKLLLTGLWTTVKIAILGLLIGIVIGTIIATVKVSPKYKLLPRILDKICTVYVAIFRGTPIAVQLLLAYYVLLPMMGVKGVPAVNVGIVVFGLNSGAYVSEIMRSGLNSVDVGQMEAGRSVGLGYGTTMLKIIIPQAIKNILPTIGNEFISLIKETSVLSFIAVSDLYVALIQHVAAVKYEWVIPYIVLALIYFVLVLIITLLIRILEKILAKNDRTKGKPKRKKQLVS